MKMFSYSDVVKVNLCRETKNNECCTIFHCSDYTMVSSHRGVNNFFHKMSATTETLDELTFT